MIEREKPRPEYAKEKISAADELLDNYIPTDRKIRPIDLFSLDDTFYEDLENCKFYSARITRTGK